MSPTWWPPSPAAALSSSIPATWSSSSTGAGRIVDANPATVQSAGVPNGLYAVSVIDDLVHPDDRDSVVSRHWATVVTTREVHPPNNFRVSDRTGARRNMALIANNQLAAPAIAGIVVNARDVTAEVEQMDAALRNQDSLVSATTRITEVRDRHTAGHQRNVAELSAAIGARAQPLHVLSSDTPSPADPPPRLGPVDW